MEQRSAAEWMGLMMGGLMSGAGMEEPLHMRYAMVEGARLLLSSRAGLLSARACVFTLDLLRRYLWVDAILTWVAAGIAESLWS